MKNIISIFLVLLLSTIGTSSAAYADETAELKSYVQRLIADGYQIANDEHLSDSEKVNNFATLIKKNLHLDWMAKYTLGRNKKSIPNNKVNEFVEVYSKFIVKVYADLAKNYNGEEVKLNKVEKLDENMFLVKTEIIKHDSASTLKIEYLVHKVNNATSAPYQIGDVITEGLSVINSQQSEFNSIISSRGIDSLINNLNQKVLKSVSQKPKSVNN